MNEREWVERFNEELDLLVKGEPAPESGDTPTAYRQDLELARRLLNADFSAASTRETILEERLLPYAEVQAQRKARWKSCLDSFFQMRPTLTWVALTILFLVVLNWAFHFAIPVPQPGEIERVVVNENAVRRSEIVLFRSERYHLNLALPADWAAVEGKESLDPSFTGWVGINSWGERAFWPDTEVYSPAAVLDHIPSDGAYIVLATLESTATEEGYGPEHAESSLENFWADQVCQDAGEPAGYNFTRFYKWGRLMRLEVFCGRHVDEETASAVNALLESWNFDPIPAGDAGWATTSTRALLPEEAGPEYFPLITNELSPGKPVARSTKEGDVLRTTQAEILDESVVAVTYTFQSGQGGTSAVSPNCSNENCQRWEFLARPDGSLILRHQEGDSLTVESDPVEAPAQIPSEPKPQSAEVLSEEPPTGELNSWSHPDEIRARLEESWSLWNTLWVDATITRTYAGEEQVTREQLWIEQPDQALWLSGPQDGNPVDIRITSQSLSAIYDLEKSALRELDRPKMVPSDLDKMVYPSWSIALRPGTFEAVQREEVAGRLALVTDYTNVEGMISDRFWIDTVTGVILRWAHFGPLPEGRGVTDEIVLNAIAYDVEFTEGLFDPELPPPQFFTLDSVLDRKNP